MITCTINGKSYKTLPNISIFNSVASKGIQIPRFCYHEALAVAGNCRMCLVEVVGMPKPIASCSILIADKMNIITTSNLVKQARHNSIELILRNHPLDCPVCDQGGMCDLQEYTQLHGSDRGRYFGEKHANNIIHLGQLIKTMMNRCILCTRCVRLAHKLPKNSFSNSIQPFISTLHHIKTYGRGEHTVISSNSSISLHPLYQKLSQYCPVGALTLKSQTFLSRPWKYKNHYFKTFDIFSSLATPLLIHIHPISLNIHLTTIKGGTSLDQLLLNTTFNQFQFHIKNSSKLNTSPYILDHNSGLILQNNNQFQILDSKPYILSLTNQSLQIFSIIDKFNINFCIPSILNEIDLNKFKLLKTFKNKINFCTKDIFFNAKKILITQNDSITNLLKTNTKINSTIFDSTKDSSLTNTILISSFKNLNLEHYHFLQNTNNYLLLIDNYDILHSLEIKNFPLILNSNYKLLTLDNSINSINIPSLFNLKGDYKTIWNEIKSFNPII